VRQLRQKVGRCRPNRDACITSSPNLTTKLFLDNSDTMSQAERPVSPLSNPSAWGLGGSISHSKSVSGPGSAHKARVALACNRCKRRKQRVCCHDAKSRVLFCDGPFQQCLETLNKSLPCSVTAHILHVDLASVPVLSASTRRRYGPSTLGASCCKIFSYPASQVPPTGIHKKITIT
jgi:hypothetical protein